MVRKKILWLCSWYPGKTEPFNGDFIQRHAQAASLYNDIYVIHVIGDDTGAIKGIEEQRLKKEGLCEQIIYFQKSSSFAGRILSHYRWTKLFRRAVRQYIHENGQPDLVHVQVPMKAGLIACWMKKKYGIPFIVTEHWGIYNDVAEDRFAFRSKAFKFYTKKIFENAIAFTSVSSFLGEGVNRWVLKKKYEVVPNVVNTTLFNVKEKPAGRFRFIHVSNMVPLKNAEGIIEAFKALLHQNPDVELVMVGNPDNKMAAYARSAGLSGDHVTFRGEVPYAQVAKEMQVADCLLLFSHIENSPCVIGEALCCGLPVISTNAGGIPELVNSSNGILMAPRDEAALTGAMLTVMNERNKYDHKKIAEDAKSKFSYEVIGKKMNAVYQAVLT